MSVSGSITKIRLLLRWGRRWIFQLFKQYWACSEDLASKCYFLILCDFMLSNDMSRIIKHKIMCSRICAFGWFKAKSIYLHELAWQATLGVPEDGIMTLELLEKLYVEQQNKVTGSNISIDEKGSNLTVSQKVHSNCISSFSYKKKKFRIYFLCSSSYNY